MDCFFASVESLDFPELKGKPVIVGGRSGRGVVCAASYEARKFGVHSAMPIRTAEKLCPKAHFQPVRMARYQEVSKHVKEIFLRATPWVQPLSLDEAFLDVTHNHFELEFATEVAERIRATIHHELGLTASAGVAPNKFIAKIASDLNKPNGLSVIPPHKIPSFLETLAIGKIWGVGPVTEKKLIDLGVRYTAELQRYPKDFLEKKFGSMGQQLYELCRGIDRREVKPSKGSKSIGRETTFAEDIHRKEECHGVLKKLCEQIFERTSQKRLQAKSLTLKLKSSDFKLHTKSCQILQTLEQAEQLFDLAMELLKACPNDYFPIRLLGLSCSRFEPLRGDAPFQWLEPNPDS